MGLFKKDTIHLTITDHSIRYLVCPDNNKKHELDYDEVVFDTKVIEEGKIIDRKKLAVTLKNIIEEKKWKGRNLYFIVPDSSVTMRSEQIPASLNKEEAKSYIKLQLEGSIRLPFKNPLIDYHITNKGEEKNDILLFAYPEDRLQPYFEIFTEVTLNPVVADLSFLSTYRVCSELGLSSEEQHLLMIQWNRYDLVLTVFHQNLPIFNRHINFHNMFENYISAENNEQILWKQPEDVRQPFIEDQLLTMERFMDFYQYSVRNGDAQITDIIFTGDVPGWDNIYQQILSRFNIPSHPISLPFELKQEYTKLYGLCMKGKDNEERKNDRY